MVRHVLGAPEMRPWLLSSTTPFALLLALGACSTSGGDMPEPSGSAERPSIPPVSQGESEESKQKAKDPTTTLTIGIASEDAVLAYFDHAEVKAKVDGVVAAEKSFVRETGKKMFPYEIVLSAPAASPNASVEITINGYTSPQAVDPINTRRLTTRFVQGKAKLSYVLLEERCNMIGALGGTGPSGPTCDPALTCIGGKCRSPELGTEKLLDYYADWATNPPSRCGDGAEPTIEAGIGLDAFSPMTSGTTVTLERGPQCGVHIWVAVRMKNLKQQGTITTISAKQPGSGILVPATGYPYTYAEADGTCELPGLRFQVDLGGTKEEDLVGKPLDVTIDATDKLGRKASVTTQVNVSPTVTGDYPYCKN